MWRIRFIFSVLLLQIALIIVRLFHLQVVRHDAYVALATGQHYHELSLPPVRGMITASDGSPLVINKPAYFVYAQPQQVENKPEFIMNLATGLSLDIASVSALFTDDTRFWVPVKHRVPAETVEKLKNLVPAGLGFEKEPVRYYPEASMAAHIVGFVASDENGNPKGYFGLEGFYNRELKGKDGLLRQEKDVRGAPIVIGTVNRIEAEDGFGLRLHLDRVVQRIADRNLSRGIEKYGAKSGTVTVMDPATGGILAMSSLPAYDPANLAEFDRGLFRNPVVSSFYEPGSTFKVLVMAAAIEAGAVTAETTFEETGPVKIGEYNIRTWNDTYRGTKSMTDVIVTSSNVGMVFAGNKLGNKELLAAIRNFGFGEKTGIDLEEETAPELRPDSEWQPIDFATATFGQGIAVTPIQMIRAAAALANGGLLVKPQVISDLVGAGGEKVPVPPESVRRVISPKTAYILTEMMIKAVDDGEAKWAKPKGYRIAGKTGTAQIPVAGHYDKDKTIASFIGFAPADKPKFIMLVTLTEPTTSPWGSETAAPLFFTIARELLTYYGITPQ